MEYIPLSKLYYKDLRQYEETYNSRFNSECAVHLDFLIHDHSAFFLELPDLLKAHIRIQNIDKKVYSVCQVLPPAALKQFRNRCLVEEIVLTNNIEGVYSTRREIGELLEDLENRSRRNRFYGLVQKYVMLTRSPNLPLSSCQDIRNIYNDLVLPEVLEVDPEDAPDGEIFRKGPVSVENAAQKEIHRGLYPEAAILSAMDKALAILNDESILPLFRAGVFHYLFGYIHPFYEGNGRTSRFISSYLLSLAFEPILGYRLSYTIKENIKKYYDAFKLCNDPRNKGDITPFLLMFVEMIELSIRHLLDALDERQSRLDHYHQYIEHLPEGKDNAELYSYLIQATLFSVDGISKKDLATLLHISETTLVKRLRPLINAGLLIREKPSRKVYYRLDLDALDQRYSALFS